MTDWVKDPAPEGTQSSIAKCAIAGEAIAGTATYCGCDEPPPVTVVDEVNEVPETTVSISGFRRR